MSAPTGNSMKLRLIICWLILCLIGCSRIPFKDADRVPLGEADPGLIISNFKEKLPDRFELLSNILFDWHKSLSAVGYIAVNWQDNLRLRLGTIYQEWRGLCPGGGGGYPAHLFRFAAAAG